MIKVRLKNATIYNQVKVFFSLIGFKAISDTRYVRHVINDRSNSYLLIGIRSYELIVQQKIKIYYL